VRAKNGHSSARHHADWTALVFWPDTRRAGVAHLRHGGRFLRPDPRSASALAHPGPSGCQTGVILLFSGATPAAAGRLAILDRVVPLGIIEASHFLGSVVGAALLLLSQGLARRLDAAYLLTMAVLSV